MTSARGVTADPGQKKKDKSPNFGRKSSFKLDFSCYEKLFLDATAANVYNNDHSTHRTNDEDFVSSDWGATLALRHLPVPSRRKPFVHHQRGPVRRDRVSNPRRLLDRRRRCHWRWRSRRRRRRRCNCRRHWSGRHLIKNGLIQRPNTSRKYWKEWVQILAVNTEIWRQKPF